MKFNVVSEPERLTLSEMRDDLARLKRELAKAEESAADPKPASSSGWPARTRETVRCPMRWPRTAANMPPWCDKSRPQPMPSAAPSGHGVRRASCAQRDSNVSACWPRPSTHGRWTSTGRSGASRLNAAVRARGVTSSSSSRNGLRSSSVLRRVNLTAAGSLYVISWPARTGWTDPRSGRARVVGRASVSPSHDGRTHANETNASVWLAGMS